MTETFNGTEPSQDTNPTLKEELSMPNPINTTDSKAVHKFTAAEIETDCPVHLETLGRNIAAHWKSMCSYNDRARKNDDKAEQQCTSIARYFAEIEEACEEGGFNALQRRFFPDLAKSRLSEVRLILTNRKSIEAVRADTRKRVTEHRAKKKAEAANSVTVTDEREPEPEPQKAPTEDGTHDAPSIVPAEGTEEQKSAASGRGAPAVKDIAVRDFNSVVAQLVQVTAKAKPRRYIDTAINPDALNLLSKFLSDIAKLKSKPSLAPQATVEQSVEDRKAENAADDDAFEGDQKTA